MEWSPWNNELGKFFWYITPNDWTRIDIDSTILSSGSAAQRDSHEEKSTDNKQRISKFENLNYWLIRVGSSARASGSCVYEIHRYSVK